MVAGAVGLPELLIILGILLLLFGAKRLPDVARSLGRSVKELQRGLDEGASEESESEESEAAEESSQGS